VADEFRIITIERAETTDPAAGNMDTIWPCATEVDATFTTSTDTPRPESIAVAEGVRIPTMSGSLID
jgi:hypothetical protein